MVLGLTVTFGYSVSSYLLIVGTIKVIRRRKDGKNCLFLGIFIFLITLMVHIPCISLFV